MKPLATIAGLLIATSMALSTSAAIAVPLSQSASLHKAAVSPVETVRHRHAHAPQRHVIAPTQRGDYGDGAYSYAPGHGVDDWSQWSPTHHPGWPCVSGPADETSAYPSWEVQPGCR
jgi:hypothetical protein